MNQPEKEEQQLLQQQQQQPCARIKTDLCFSASAGDELRKTSHLGNHKSIISIQQLLLA